jgi:hypothetical protein
MKANKNVRLFLGTILIGLLGLALATNAPGSEGQTPDKQPVVFKAPNGYMPADLSKHIGKLLLDPKKPAGMFVGYPSDGQDIAGFRDEMKNLAAQMFLHDSKGLEWSAVVLPPHKGLDSESGNLMTTSDDKMEVQLAFYVRADKGLAYGYFGMRHKKAKGDDAKFLDAAGAGLKALDELAASIK